MAKITFTREAPMFYEDGPSYEILRDGEFVGEITSWKVFDINTGSDVIGGYTVDLLHDDGPDTTFAITRTVREWGGVYRKHRGHDTARGALAAAKAHARARL